MTRVFLMLFLSVIIGADAAGSQPQLNQPMHFFLFKPCSELSPRCELRVLAQGDIQLDSALALAAFLQQWGRQGVIAPWVCFDSLGGNLGGALAMGALIRSKGLDTCMARTYTDVVENQAGSVQLSDEAVCASACAYALAGGVTRRVAYDAVVAVHQFYSTGRNASQDMTQRVMTEVGRYLDKMGVQRALLDAATEASPWEVDVLSDAQMLKFDLKTEDLATSEPWALRTGSGGGLVAWTAASMPGLGSTEIMAWRSDVHTLQVRVTVYFSTDASPAVKKLVRNGSADLSIDRKDNRRLYNTMSSMAPGEPCSAGSGFRTSADGKSAQAKCSFGLRDDMLEERSLVVRAIASDFPARSTGLGRFQLETLSWLRAQLMADWALRLLAQPAFRGNDLQAP